jgi:hypothetical protein
MSLPLLSSDLPAGFGLAFGVTSRAPLGKSCALRDHVHAPRASSR